MANANESAGKAVPSEGKRLKPSKIFFYGLNDVGNNLVYVTLLSYLMYFSSEVNLISTAVIGTLSLVARIFDAFNDILIGTWSNNTRTKMGRFRPWIIWGMIPTVVFTVLIFLKLPGDWSEFARNAYICIIYCAWTFAFTMIYIPYTSMAAVLSTNIQDTAKLTSSRIGMGQIGNVVTSFTVICATALGGGDMSNGFTKWVLILCAVSIVCWVLNVVNQKEVIIPPKVAKENKKEHNSGQIAGYFKKGFNKYYVFTLIAMSVYGFFLLGRSGVYAYYFQFYANDMDMLATFQVVMYVAIAFGCVIAPFIMKRVKNKGPVVAWSALISGVGVMASGLFNPSDNQVGYMILTFVNMGANGLFNGIMWSLIPDTIDYGHWKKGYRNEGLASSGATFFMKLGMGLGTFVCGVAIAAAGYEPGAAVQTASAVNMIHWYMTYIMGAVMAAVGVIFFFYDLTYKKQVQIRKELIERGELNIDSESVAETETS